MATFVTTVIKPLIEGNLDYSSYVDYVVLAGKACSIYFHMNEECLSGYNEEVLFSDFGVDLKLAPDDNVIEFTLRGTGTCRKVRWNK